MSKWNLREGANGNGRCSRSECGAVIPHGQLWCHPHWTEFQCKVLSWLGTNGEAQRRARAQIDAWLERMLTLHAVRERPPDKALN
jgi:hypothetical protein